jgi:hypothetical protein
MKDIKGLREFKTIKNGQKAKKGAIMWTSALAVALAIYFAFPFDEGSLGTMTTRNKCCSHIAVITAYSTVLYTYKNIYI